jgi:hypothetical protein
VRGRPTRTAESFTLPWKSVFVEEIDDKGVAHCVDQFGKPISLPVAVRRGKGALPAVGERWIIDRSLSNRWTFAAVQSARPPTITGERDANGALGALLTALVDAGLVVDATTEGTGGGGPGGPGVTDHGALTGLGDDDHPQYHTDARGDVRYYTKAGGDTHYDARYDVTTRSGRRTTRWRPTSPRPIRTSSTCVSLRPTRSTTTWARPMPRWLPTSLLTRPTRPE